MGTLHLGTLLLFFLFYSTPVCPFLERPLFALDSYSQAIAAYRDRRLDEALQYAREAVREEPENVEALALLGELYYLRQDLTRAQENWERALKLAPSRKDIQERLAKLKREAKVETSLARSDTYPFVLRFEEGQVPTSLGGLRQMLRQAHRLIGQSFDYFPDHPITVLIYHPKDFEKVKGISHQVSGLYDGKIRLPVAPGPEAVLRLKGVLWHEYTHAIVHDLAKGNCPVWLNEGIAVLQEARIRPPDLSVVRQAQAKAKLLSFKQLWEDAYTQADLALYYAQAYLVAQYLVKRWGWRGIAGLLKRLAQGFPVGDALRAQYRVTPADLEKEFFRWLTRHL